MINRGEPARERPKRPPGLSAAIVVNGLMWTIACAIYVAIFATMMPPQTTEQCSNVTSAANLLWLPFHFWGLLRLWRRPDDKGALRHAMVTHSISLFYSVQSPLLTSSRFLFLDPGATESTLTMVLVDITASLVLTCTTSAFLIRHCWRRLGTSAQAA